MTYKNHAHYSHSEHNRVGVLITNLGTPDAPTAGALRPYLKQFLSDPRVVEIPRVLWWLVLNLVILRIRPRRSAASYQSVWTDEGSPLAIHTKNQHQALSLELGKRYGDDVLVEWAMRYGKPSIGDALQRLLDKGVRKLMVLPLYPQYSASTTASTFDAVADDFTKRRWMPELRFITSYCDNPAYIHALANSIRAHWKAHSQPEKLVFSYHGIPQRYLNNGDPYHCFCYKTTRLVAQELKLEESQYVTSFQSRFGREPWLQPYTDETLKHLASTGIKSVAVICPGFSSDCLETIEEIDEENRGYFMEAGGENFHYIPALNAQPEHISVLADICSNNIRDWLPMQSEEEDINRNQRYEKLKQANKST